MTVVLETTVISLDGSMPETKVAKAIRQGWRLVILCFICRKPPERLMKVQIETFALANDLYCHDDHDLSVWWTGSPRFRPSDVFVAVRKCTP